MIHLSDNPTADFQLVLVLLGLAILMSLTFGFHWFRAVADYNDMIERYNERGRELRKKATLINDLGEEVQALRIYTKELQRYIIDHAPGGWKAYLKRAMGTNTSTIIRLPKVVDADFEDITVKDVIDPAMYAKAMATAQEIADAKAAA